MIGRQQVTNNKYYIVYILQWFQQKIWINTSETKKKIDIINLYSSTLKAH